MKHHPAHIILLIAMLLLSPTPTTTAWGIESLMQVPTRSEVKQPFILVEPDTPPVANVILFTGGSGKLRTYHRGTKLKNKNFLVRSRKNFASHGFLVAVVDTPSDLRSEGLYSFRTTLEHARDIEGVMDWLRKKFDVPIFLVGTSRGAISAAGVTAQLKSNGVSGIILTSTVTRYNSHGDDSIFDVNMEQILTPVLVVYHEGDNCYVTPFIDADRLMDSLVKVKSKKLLSYRGGNPPESDACKPLSEHGFYGIENKVVSDIAEWIKKQTFGMKQGL